MRAKSNEEDWNGYVEKMSLWELERYSHEREVNLSKGNQQLQLLTRECPNVSTLLVRVSREVSLWGLMNCIPNVRVLCFSGSDGMRQLQARVSNLENLEYLDISHTRIRRLPKEMKSLRKLRYLLMSYMGNLVESPAELISNLTELLMFHMYHPPSTEELLRVLEKLPHIQDTCTCLETPEALNYLHKSEKLQLCTTSIHIGNMIVEELELSPINMRNLESLFIENNSNINAVKCKIPDESMIFNCLRHVSVSGCDGLKELDMLAYAPSLILLKVENCTSIKNIIKEEEPSPVFESLKDITLKYLPSLEKISNRSLSFPTLERVEIIECPKLKQNPFNAMDPTTTTLWEILGTRKWWDSLHWSDDRLQLHFSRFFRKLPGRE